MAAVEIPEVSYEDEEDEMVNIPAAAVDCQIVGSSGVPCTYPTVPPRNHSLFHPNQIKVKLEPSFITVVILPQPVPLRSYLPLKLKPGNIKVRAKFYPIGISIHIPTSKR